MLKPKNPDYEKKLEFKDLDVVLVVGNPTLSSAASAVVSADTGNEVPLPKPNQTPLGEEHPMAGCHPDPAV